MKPVRIKYYVDGVPHITEQKFYSEGAAEAYLNLLMLVHAGHINHATPVLAQ